MKNLELKRLINENYTCRSVLALLYDKWYTFLVSCRFSPPKFVSSLLTGFFTYKVLQLPTTKNKDGE